MINLCIQLSLLHQQETQLRKINISDKENKNENLYDLL